MRKGHVVILLISLVLLLSGCLSQQTKQSFVKDIEKYLPISGDSNKIPGVLNPPEPQDQQDLEPEKGNTQPQAQGSLPIAQGNFPGCDNICDDFEKQVKEQSPCYKPDCLGIKENNSFEQPITGNPQPATGIQQPENIGTQMDITATNSTYKIANMNKKPTGWFETGQDADIMLSGIDFNNSGGPLLFNHPSNLASDGTHLLLADRNNNRILIWNKLPEGNVEPDLVLGQKDFYSNNPGNGLDELNWPVSVAAANGKVIVADTYNDRLLIWNEFPTKNGQAADIVIADACSGVQDPKLETGNSKRCVGWPWAVWTNGEKLVVTSTGTSSVMIWNTFPTKNNQAADIRLTANGKFGTPRSIGSDGKSLMIGDHNAKPNNGGAGNFFWKEFPTEDDEPYDFFVFTPQRMGEKIFFQEGSGQLVQGDVMWGGTFTPEGKFIVISNKLYIWDSFPENENDAADLTVGTGGGPGDKKPGKYAFIGGDGSGAVFAGGRLYIGMYNGNRIVAYNSLPTKETDNPDFAIGAPDIGTNTLETGYFATNPVPLTDGKSLFILSNYDHKMYVWKNVPDQSGAKPDFVYKISPPPKHAAIVRDSLVLDNGNNIFIWKKLPLNWEKPDITFNKTFSGIEIAGISCIVGDDKYFYISSSKENKTYVWDEVPFADTSPKITISTVLGGGGGAGSRGGEGCHSDGTYISTISTFEHSAKIYRIAEMLSNPENPPAPISVGRPGGMFNLPEDALVSDGHLFVADTISSRVLVWERVEDAIAGKDADVILGAESLTEKLPEIGKNKLFWPAGLAFDGTYLWVGEFKFSGRLIRFSVQ